MAVTVHSISDELAARLYTRAGGGRWALPPALFAAALQRSVDRAFATRAPGAGDPGRYLESLHLEDLALASACAAGSEAAWDQFIREQRPGLYRAADALDRTGAARELADAIYADLYGIDDRGGDRRSLFRYFHGRSSLATWLRAVLAQRHVDRLRAGRRLEPLPEDEGRVEQRAIATAPIEPAVDRPRWLASIQRALTVAISLLSPRDRLRLVCYYSEQLTLAQTGRVLGEHEATVSRQLARTRGAIRREVERYLGSEGGLNSAQIAHCFECALDDAGSLDLSRILTRKDPASDRSI